LYGSGEYDKADAHARSVNYKKTDYRELSTLLTSPFSREDEKARAVFTWIALNISYDVQKFLNLPKRVEFSYTTEEERIKILEKIAEEGIAATLKKRKGVCEDYSNLFAAMCKSSGVEVLTVEGNARNDVRYLGKKTIGNSHQWNAVKKDGRWMITDVTWGAGYVDFAAKKFIKDFRGEYFLIDPQRSIFTHVPLSEENQFLKKTFSAQGISELPVAGFGLIKYGVEGFNPDKSNLKPGNDGNAIIRIKLSKSPGLFLVTVSGKRSEIKPEKDAEGYLVFRIPVKGKEGLPVTVSGVDNTVVNDILSYRVRAKN
jgi:hypothetical protein